MNLGYAKKKKGKECLRLSECGLRRVIYELGRAKLHAKIWQSNKNNKIFRGVGVCVYEADVITHL